MKNKKTAHATDKQRKAAEIAAQAIVEGRHKPKKEILREAGYSDAVTTTPGKIMETDTFQALLNELLPEELTVKRHKELVITDNEAVAIQAVKLAHQLRGRLENVRQAQQQQVVINFGNAPSSAVIEGEVVDISAEHGD